MTNNEDYIKRPEEHILEDESRLEFERRLPRSWIIENLDNDYGLDLAVTIVEGDKVTNKVFWVQLKATNNDKLKSPIPFRIKTKHLKHYEY
jgi:hypothetical protein